MNRAALAALVLALVWSAPAEAHHPWLACERSGDAVRCTGGFSEGEDARGIIVDVVADDGTVLIPGRLGEDSAVSFTAPKQSFYVLFDAGAGHTAEVDDSEIVLKPLTTNR